MKFDSGFSKTEKTGYLLPSITLALSVGLWLLGKKHYLAQVPQATTSQAPAKYGNSLNSTIDVLNSLFSGNSAITVVLIFLTTAALIFILAHVIDTVSEYIFERLFANKMQGYPHERLVPFSETTTRYVLFRAEFKTSPRASRFLYEGLKSTLFIFIAFPLAWMTYRYSKIGSRTWEFPTWMVDAINYWVLLSLLWSTFLLLVFCFNRFVSNSKDPLAEREYRVAEKLKATHEDYRVFNAILGGIWFIVIGFWSYSFDVLEKTIRSLFQLNMEIDGHVYEKARRYLLEKISIDIKALKGNDRVWIPYYHLITEKKDSVKHIQDFESKAMFYRNQAFALFISCALLAGSFESKGSSITTFLSPKDFMHLAFASYFLAIFFVGRYFQHYYSISKTIYRACAVLAASNPSPSRSRKISQLPQ
jgi:hypothetical protein